MLDLWSARRPQVQHHSWADWRSLRTSAAPELIDPARVGAPTAGARFQLTLQVPDVDAVCRQLAERGVSLLNGPVDRPWGPRTASFQDPAWHIWEVAS